MNASSPASSSTRPQYLLSFAVLGSIVPFLSVLLKDRGLSPAQIGWVTAVASTGVILTPLLVTLLADTAISGCYLVCGLFALGGIALLPLLWAGGFWAALVLYSLHCFAIFAIFPLQDGVYFSAQARCAALGLAQTPYHVVRVWGTVGYIIPSAALYFFLGTGGSMAPAIYCAIACCLLGAIYALLALPRTPPPQKEAHARLPTVAALRAMLEPHVLVFCIAMLLAQIASAAYYYGYPLHLVERCGIAKRWVGLAANVGVLLEIGYILMFGELVRRLSLRRVMYLGALGIALRMLLLAASPSAAVAIGQQVIHGLTVLTTQVAPPIFLNQRADDRYRNSIQGLYMMLFAGSGRVIGGLSAGLLAQHSLQLMFYAGSGVALLATGLFYFAFSESRTPRTGPSASKPGRGFRRGGGQGG